MTDYPHLDKNVAKWLSEPDELRIEYIRKTRWITYSRAKEGLEKLEDLLHYPKTHRMPNLLLLGNTNNGKTALAKHFIRQNPAYDNPKGDSIIVPALYIQSPPKPDEARLYNAILDSVYCPYKRTSHVSEKLSLVIDVCQNINLKMLFIDEIQNVLAGSTNQQRHFMQVLKYIGNELQIPIVAIGVREALRAIQTEEQLANRFEPFALPKWELNADFVQLLASFERLLPLKQPSNLASPQLAPKLLVMSNGLLGELSTILQKAAVFAVKNKIERVDESVLNNIDWVAPDERRKMAERVIR
ncbi:TniB family NTP-binding protein [Vibrio fluvialis]|nr:TniB family NTP-binding protein [Vibrio fluvialis]